MNNTWIVIKKIWNYGTITPVQRSGLIILGFGLISLISWAIKNNFFYYTYYYPNDFFPTKRDSFFYHLYLYLIPVGLLMTWGYHLLYKIKFWIFNGKNINIFTDKNKSSQSLQEQKNIYFKNNLAALKFVSKNYTTQTTYDQINIGIVQDRVLTKDGKILFVIAITNDDNPILVGGFNHNFTTSIVVGNLVYWDYIGPQINENSFHIEVLGIVTAILSPEFNPNTSRWVIQKDLTQ